MGRTLAVLAVVVAALWPLPMSAQEDDRSYLTALLEDNLSGAGRQVQITGFEGALSSQARLTSLTIADDAGVWIALTDVVLDWQRSDLLAGKITVNKLTAGEIVLSRLPNSGEAQINPEAPAFALPSLPVAINIGEIAVEKLRIAAGVLGQEVNARASAAMQLAGGEGQGSLILQRDAGDAAQGRAEVEISFANATRQLKINLAANESQGGILAQALGIPDAPAMEFTIEGDAPLTDFAADIALRSDGAPRFGGRVAWASTDPQAGGTSFNAELAGDVSVLVKPEFRAFFGSQTTLRAQGQTRADGGFDMPIFALTSAAMDISGQLSLAATGQPDAFALRGQLLPPTGGALTLPLALEMPAMISSAQITADFDAAKGDTFRVAGQLQGWTQDDLRIANSAFSVDGRLGRSGAGAQVDAALTFTGEGVLPSDAALSRALGTVIWGDGAVKWQQGGALTLTALRVMGEDYQAQIDGTLGDLAKGVTFEGKLGVSAQDFGRFAGLIGQPIAGAGRMDYAGTLSLLTRAFDGKLGAQTTDLRLGIAALDASLAGQSSLQLSARRDEAGVTLRDATLEARGISAQLSGKIAGENSAVSGRFELKDLPVDVRGFGGAVTGQVALNGPLRDAVIDIAAQSEGLTLADPTVQKLAGQRAEIAAKIALHDLAPQVISASLTAPQVSVQLAQARAGGAYDITAALADLGAILPQFPGRVTLAGSAAVQEGGAALDLAINGPAQLNAQITGQASAEQTNDLRLSGRADAALINAFIAPRSISGDTQFDLRLLGRPALEAVSGTIAVRDGRLADPSLPFTLRAIVLDAQVAGGQAVLSGSADASTGGKITLNGQVATTAAYDTDLQLSLRDLTFAQSSLFQSTMNGALTLRGPMFDGAILQGDLELGRTEVQLTVPTIIEGAPLQNLAHKGDSAAAKITRERAGFEARSNAPSDGARIGLDITVRAANRLFVRGRGLDAELGGEVRLQGDTNDVRPNGSFDLVQGHFDILTTRLDLESVRLELRGAFIPFLSVRATNAKSGILTTAIIDGPALDPDFKFASVPELPEEDVLAQLLFDQSLQNLTALQAVQLTSAMASLTGRGEGLIARARKAMHLDNFDLQSDEAGNSALRLGKYVSDNVYSQLSSEGTGKQSLDFTYTLNEKIKLRAGTQTTGNTSIGIEIETNY